MGSTSAQHPSWRRQGREMLSALRGWPWVETVGTLRQRFREDRLGLTAGSLTFTTLIALVPLVTVMLALFTAFPMFASFQGALEKYFLQSLVPDGIARPVLRSLTQFAGKARGVGTLGLLLLGATALALMLTIDRTLNGIWRVRRPRPMAQRVLVYWAALTLGPLALGSSLSLTSYALTASRGLVEALPGGLETLLDLLQFGLLGAAMAGLYHYVPNTFVRWRHAWAGGLFVAVGVEVAKAALAWYVRVVPTFSAVYGVFATLPILLLWIYIGWVIVLLGAVIAAYAPTLHLRSRPRPDTPGQAFALALDLLRELDGARRRGESGCASTALAARLHLDPRRFEPLLERLLACDWVGRLDEAGEQRWVLLCDPAQARVAPLVACTLLDAAPDSPAWGVRQRLDGMTLSELLAT